MEKQAVIEKRKIPYALPDVGEQEINEVIDSIKSNWLSKGPKTVKFEEEFARYVGSEHAVALNSCTAGLHLALKALNIGPGDEVITTPYTFAATVNTIIHVGATPVLVDINLDTMNIDSSKVAAKITDKTKAIVPVHFAGYPCEMDELRQLADQYKLFIIEDAAHAVHTQYKGKMIGSMSDVTCFSFYATKNLVTGEGGMITTNNEELANRIRVLSLHGMSKNAWNRYSDKGSWYYEIEEAGFKYNMTDIQAAFGLVQLNKIDDIHEKRTAIAAKYNEAFEGIQGLTLPYDSSEDRHAWHLYVLRVDEQHFTINREQFIEVLNERGVGTSVHFIPIPMHPYYKNLGYKIEDYPNAQLAFKQAISLPLYPKMSNEDIGYVIQTVVDVANEYKK